MKVFCLFTLLVALSAARVIEDVKEAPEQGLQGYFDTLKEIYYKLKELGHETVCGKTVTELLELLGLPDAVDGIVATARGWVCNALSAPLQVRDVAQPQALQGYFDTLRQIISKLRELGVDTVCGQTVSELIDLLGLPDFLDGIVATARGFVCNALSLQVRDAAQPQALQGYFDTLRQIIYKLKELGHDTVCGSTVSELIELLGLPDILDGIVATARGFVCSALSLQVRDAAQPQALQGYFDTLRQIISKLKELGHDTVCGSTVSELIELLGLPDFLNGIVATARGFVCSALSLQVRDAAQPQALQGYFDTLRQIISKLRELGHETVCGQTVSELIDLLGLPSILDSVVATARGFICSALSLQVRDAAQPQALQGYFDTLRQIISKLKELGHDTVCGSTVSELIELLGLPDFLDGIVATARGFICSALSLQVRDAAQPQALQGYFDTLRQIIYKLKELGHDTVCGSTVSELIELLGLPDILDGIVATARGFVCSALSLQVRDAAQPQALQGYFDTLRQIIFKLKEIGHETVCGQSTTELLELLGLPDILADIVATARGFVCSVLSLEARSDVLQGDGLFAKTMEIFYKLLAIGQETVCGESVSELIDLLGLPSGLENVVATARGWVCSI